MSGTKRSFGSLRKLPSKRWQARYTDPATGETISAPHTFQTKQDAAAWLAARQTDISRGRPIPQPHRRDGRVTFAAYAEQWLYRRDLKPRTRAEYRRLLDRHLMPTFGTMILAAITPEDVREWYAEIPTKVKKSGATEQARTYGLMRTIMGTAVMDDVITANPCRVRGGGQVKRARAIRPATLDELRVIVEATPERFRAMVLLAAWCALRFGELTELRRKDVDLSSGVLRVRRGVVRIPGEPAIVDTPKSEAGSRDVAVPPHLLPVLADHLKHHAQAGLDGLLFPSASGRQLAPSSAYDWWYPARTAAGREDLAFHGLRHTGGTLAAASGATLAELMSRLGHSTPAAALIYQHAAAERDRIIAEKLSELAARG